MEPAQATARRSIDLSQVGLFVRCKPTGDWKYCLCTCICLRYGAPERNFYSRPITWARNNLLHVRTQNFTCTHEVPRGCVYVCTVFTENCWRLFLPAASGPGKAVGPVCVCVRTITLELNDR